MRELSTELKVGTFALLVIIMLAFMTFKVGGLEWAKGKGYRIYVYFDNIAGLDEKTRVKIAGVDVGIVKSIELFNGRAKIKLRIDPDIRIYQNAAASIRSTGLLGDKYLNINIGSPDSPLLKDGDTINKVTEFVEMDDLAKTLIEESQNFSKLVESLNKVFGTEDAKDSLSQIIENLRELTGALNKTITVNDQKLRTVLDNINDLTVSISNLIEKNRDPLTSTIADIQDFSNTIKISGPELVLNLKEASKELRAMVEENRQGIKSAVESLDNIAKRVDSGEGSLGKLIKDDRLYESINKAAEGLNKTFSAIDRFKIFLTFQTEYLSELEDGKGYFYLTIQPRPDKYYIFGVVGDPLGRVTTTETTITPPGTVVKEDVVEKKIEFTAQFARRFGNTAVRIGLTENTFGVGGDYFFYNDKGKITADIWDFSNREEGSKNPHLKVGLDFFLFKSLFLSAGADNIINTKWRGGYIGMGLRFEDEDFKYLLNALP